jgi:hypothetical protein
MSDDVLKAQIMVEVYRAADGLRWRIRSAYRGRRVVADSAESYVRKADLFRGLLLTTGGRYVRTFRMRSAHGGVYEQGSILRRSAEGPVEDIFVSYVSWQEDAR